MSLFDTPSDSRRAHVLLSLALGAAAIGFVQGTHRPSESPTAFEAASGERRLEPGVRPAPSYAELRAAQYRAEPGRHEAAFAAMKADRPGVLDAVARDEATLVEARSARAGGRAYAGAPPTIPHPIDQRGYPNCVHCHDDGLRVGGRHAAMRSHGDYANCTQCHATRESAPPLAATAARPSPETSFVGERDEPGVRAYAGAPPTMPHTSFMRERCESCHGLMGEGIRSTHPWRQSCPQCHAPSAALEQRSFAPPPRSAVR